MTNHDESPPDRTVLAAVIRDLDAFPERFRRSATALAAQALAESIDLGTETYRHQGALVAQLMACMQELRELAPPKIENDSVDEINAKRAARQRKAAG